MPVLMVIVALCDVGWLATPACAITRHWQTGGPSSNWSNPDNWNPAGTPQSGDDLYFSDSFLVLGPDDMVNDLTNLVVRSLNFYLAGYYIADWALSGNPITVIAGISAAADVSAHINYDITLGGHAVFSSGLTGVETEIHVNGGLDLNGYDLRIRGPSSTFFELAGPIAGNGNILVTGPVEFSGAQGNTFSGTLTVPNRLRVEGGWVTLARPDRSATTPPWRPWERSRPASATRSLPKSGSTDKTRPSEIWCSPIAWATRTP